jgi:hypothetical protein
MQPSDPMHGCSARRKNGMPCGNRAIQGGTVCRMHGGSAPQVRAKAAERLAALVDPAIGVLARAMKQKKNVVLAVVAARDVLDRNNLSGKQKIELDAGPNIVEILRGRKERVDQENAAREAKEG